MLVSGASQRGCGTAGATCWPATPGCALMAADPRDWKDVRWKRDRDDSLSPGPWVRVGGGYAPHAYKPRSPRAGGSPRHPTPSLRSPRASSAVSPAPEASERLAVGGGEEAERFADGAACFAAALELELAERSTPPTSPRNCQARTETAPLNALDAPPQESLDSGSELLVVVRADSSGNSSSSEAEQDEASGYSSYADEREAEIAVTAPADCLQPASAAVIRREASHGVWLIPTIIALASFVATTSVISIAVPLARRPKKEK